MPSLDALFLDRDGTLIVERGFLGDPSGVRITRGARSALRPFTDGGTKLFVVTNQSGIARGLITWKQVHAVNAEVRRRLEKGGVPIEAFLVCSHHPDHGPPCRCRKPKTYLHRQALARYGLDPRRCAVIGDKWDDVGAGVRLGAIPIHVLTGFGRKQRPIVKERAPEVLLATSLTDALKRLASRVNSGGR